MTYVLGEGPDTEADRAGAIAGFLQLLHPDPDAVFEIRIPDCLDEPGKPQVSTWSGYFQSARAVEAAREILRIDAEHKPPAVYVTLNTINPTLLARAVNRVRPAAKNVTADADVTARRWLVVDLEPKRPGSVSATETEQAATLQRAFEIRDTLAAEEWPAPVICLSGNGAYLLYRVSLPNDEASRGLLHRAFKGLAARFNTESIKLDPGVFNASHPIKVIGTTVRKGDALVGVEGQEDRPHRIASMVEAPPRLLVLRRAQLEAATLSTWPTAADKMPQAPAAPERPEPQLEPQAAARESPVAEIGGPAETQRLAVPTLEVELERAAAWLPAQHGRSYVGLAAPESFPKFSRHTLGLRGLTLLTAPPGVGKTAFGLQLGTVIARHHAPGHPLGSACFVFFSFEMSRQAMTLRLMAAAAGIPWRRLLLGDPNALPDATDGLRLDAADRARYQEGLEGLRLVARRVAIIDAAEVRDADWAYYPSPAPWLRARIEAVKARCQVERAFVLIDNLQAIPVAKDPLGNAWRSDADRDRYMIGQLLTVARQLPDDPLLVISEQGKATSTAADIEGMVGSGRAACSPDLVLYLKPRPVRREEQAPASEAGTTSVDLLILKARDGMQRGAIPMTFHHLESRFEEADDPAPGKHEKKKSRGKADVRPTPSVRPVPPP